MESGSGGRPVNQPSPPPITELPDWLEDTSPTPAARMRAPDGTLLTQATTSSIEAKVYDEQDNLRATIAVVVADVIFDTLQTPTDDVRWHKDTTGFNFLHRPAPSSFPEPGRYGITYTFTLTSGEVVSHKWVGRALSVRGS